MTHLWKLAFFSAIVGLVSCAPTTSTMQASETRVAPVEMQKAQEIQPSETDDLPQPYWVKKLDLPVFDGSGSLIRTLRLQPKVDVFEINGNLGRIDETLDHWVDLSDFTVTEPDPPLVRHEFTGRPPKVELSRPDQ